MKQCILATNLLLLFFIPTLFSQADSVEVTFHVDFSKESKIESWGGAVGIFQPAFAELNMNYNGDSTYSLTVKFPVDTRLEYKFKNKAAGGEFEDLDNTCPESNRFYLLPDDVTPIDLGMVCYTACEECRPDDTPMVDVTFHVDLSNESKIESWGGAVGIFEPAFAEHNMIYNGDSTYSLTLKMPANTRLEYKFKNKAAGGEFEDLDNTCPETNRFFIIPDDDEPIDLGLVCYTTCEACVPRIIPNVPVTFNVDLSNEIEIQSWGGALAIFEPAFAEHDMIYNGDSTYSVTLDFPINTPLKYRFKNRAAGPDFEELDPSCGASNRTFTLPADTTPVNLDLICYQFCEPCKAKEKVNVNFRVEVSGMDLNGQKVFIAGDFTDNNLKEMFPFGNPDNQVFTSFQSDITVGQHEVLFYIGGFSEVFDPGCQTITPLGYRRIVVAPSSDDQTMEFCFAQCECPTVSTKEIFNENNDFVKIFPTIITDRLVIQKLASDFSESKISVFDLSGKPVFYQKTDNRTQELKISTTNWKSGVYVVRFQTNNKQFLKRIIKI